MSLLSTKYSSFTHYNIPCTKLYRAFVKCLLYSSGKCELFRSFYRAACTWDLCCAALFSKVSSYWCSHYSKLNPMLLKDFFSSFLWRSIYETFPYLFMGKTPSTHCILFVHFQIWINLSRFWYPIDNSGSMSSKLSISFSCNFRLSWQPVLSQCNHVCMVARFLSCLCTRYLCWTCSQVDPASSVLHGL